MRDKLYIFALDGVLVDSKHLYARAIEQTFDDQGYETGIAKLVGHDLTKDYDPKSDLSNGDDTLNKIQALLASDLQPMTGVEHVLELLPHTCVMAEERKIEAKTKLLKTGLIKFFKDEHIFPFMTLEPSRLPLSSLLLFTVRSMGFAASNAIFITDEEGDIPIAQQAGLNTIHFTGGSHMTKATPKTASSMHVLKAIIQDQKEGVA